MAARHSPNRNGERESQNTELTDALNKSVNWSNQDTLHLASLLYEGLDTPVTLGLYLRLKYGLLAEVVCIDSPNPLFYDDRDWTRFSADVQGVKFLSKAAIDVENLYPELKSWETFLDCERANKLENEFWNDVDAGRCSLTPTFESVLIRVREVIEQILGEFNISEWLDHCRLGPGMVAFGPKGTDVYVKLSEKLGITQNLSDFLPSIMEEYPGWFDGLTFDGNFDVAVNVHRGGKYTQVPKSAKTNRNIETQPLINSFLQLGLGQVIRRRLLSAGVDLSDQSRNQRMAFLGSKHAKYCTIDLENASDSISKGVIYNLLPRRWLHALNICRTEEILIDGQWRRLHRFSSMGNGYTFELESLVFYAIALVSSKSRPRDVSVFGDDIIVPNGRYTDVTSCLRKFGFRVNSGKSYHSSPFRESCGADYFNGHATRPFYMKEIPTDEPSIIRVANGLARSACRFGSSYYLSARFERAIRFCHSKLSRITRSTLARGWPDDDTYLFWPRLQSGFRLEFHEKKLTYTSYYSAKTALLYKMHKASTFELRTGKQSYFWRPDTIGHWKVGSFDVFNWYRAWPQAFTPQLSIWA